MAQELLQRASDGDVVASNLELRQPLHGHVDRRVLASQHVGAYLNNAQQNILRGQNLQLLRGQLMHKALEFLPSYVQL